MVGRKDRADFPFLHGEGNILKFIHQIATLEKTQVNFLSRFVRKRLSHLGKILSLNQSISYPTTFLEEPFPILGLPHGLEDMQRPDPTFLGIGPCVILVEGAQGFLSGIFDVLVG